MFTGRTVPAQRTTYRRNHRAILPGLPVLLPHANHSPHSTYSHLSVSAPSCLEHFLLLPTCPQGLTGSGPNPSGLNACSCPQLTPFQLLRPSFCPCLRDLAFSSSSVWSSLPPVLQILVPSHHLGLAKCHYFREEPSMNTPTKATPSSPTHIFLVSGTMDSHRLKLHTDSCSSLLRLSPARMSAS